MSPGQGLYLCAVAIATPVMINTGAPLCQVGEVQRSGLWVSITAGCWVVIFWQCQRAWGLPSGEVWGSQWGERDAGPIRTPNTQPHSKRRHMSSKTFQSPLVAHFLPGVLLPLRGLLCSGHQGEAGAGADPWIQDPTCPKAEHPLVGSLLHPALCWLGLCVYKLSQDHLDSFSHPLKHKACNWEQCH